jgi:hypothetical protein
VTGRTSVGFDREDPIETFSEAYSKKPDSRVEIEKLAAAFATEELIHVPDEKSGGGSTPLKERGGIGAELTARHSESKLALAGKRDSVGQKSLDGGRALHRDREAPEPAPILLASGGLGQSLRPPRRAGDTIARFEKHDGIRVGVDSDARPSPRRREPQPRQHDLPEGGVHEKAVLDSDDVVRAPLQEPDATCRVVGQADPLAHAELRKLRRRTLEKCCDIEMRDPPEGIQHDRTFHLELETPLGVLEVAPAALERVRARRCSSSWVRVENFHDIRLGVTLRLAGDARLHPFPRKPTRHEKHLALVSREATPASDGRAELEREHRGFGECLRFQAKRSAS